MESFSLPSTSMAVAVTSSESDSDVSLGVEDLKLIVGPVRRTLFGPIDHHQLQLDFQKLLYVNVEVANKRWNFDFQSDQPVQGSAIMEWEELRYQDVPAFYRSCVLRRTAGTRASRRTSSISSTSSDRSSGDELPEETRLPFKGKQASITDFYKVKRLRRLHYKGLSRH